MKTSKVSVTAKTVPKIHICTPSFNSAKTIEDTILSVMNQKGKFEVFYHVQDGGSEDSTLAILEKYHKKIQESASTNPQINFTFNSKKDAGMYDAIAQGFSTFNMTSDSWMTWINSDDRLAPGALNFICGLSNHSATKNVQWIGGKTSMMNEKGERTEFLLPINSEIIKLGLCDGLHWGYLQQEGLFFRNALWNKIDLEKSFTNFKYAGDWSLWRVFSEHEKMHQVDKVLGTFYKRNGQLSEVNREGYMLEIDNSIPNLERYKRFANLSIWNNMRYEISYDNDFSIIEKNMKGAIQYWQRRRKEEGLNEQAAFTKIDKNIIAFDSQWQFPAITEQHAFNMMQSLLIKKDLEATYFAFPWATLIDLLHNKKPEGQKLLRMLKSFKMFLKDKIVITVCQHIFMTQYMHLFDEIGVSDVYWTHAVNNQTSLPSFPSVKIHPFPLYPVQAIDIIDEKNILDRKYLFSFVGARASKWYLTESRNMIIDLLKDHPRGEVIARDTWHYNKAVYEHQVNKVAIKKEELVDKDTTAEFKNILRESIFALCPSGSGPNSIRLWESIAYGVIPVILADTYLPPGNPQLWSEAAVSCKEDADSIEALPAILAEIANDKSLLQRKRNALKQLWLIYGPDCFVYDILKKFIQYGETVSGKINSLLSCKEMSILYGSDAKSQELFLLSCTSKLLLDHKAFLNEIQSCEISYQFLKSARNKNNKYLHVFDKTVSLKNIDFNYGAK
jgi:glycosyltransferase involved in cell wall biosynthesis